jgi:choline dehydrogenase-like flavoprotein
VELDALVTRVILDEQNRTTGVEYLKGKRLYRAHGQPATAPGVLSQAQATREVILCGGAFNTPQLLMLSGIGPCEVLEPLGITVRIELPGVGKNLQDRYEVGVVNRMSFDHWKILEGLTFSRGDRAYQEWADRREGLYSSNGAVLAAILKSQPERPLPDLFCFALLGLFGGYFPSYSAAEVTKPNYLTWAILKAHTQNRAGEVALRSADPQDTPLINFHYFDEGSDTAGEDLQSVVAGIRFVRQLTAKLKAQGLIAEEEQPGEALQTDDELMGFVRNTAWGHHASCSCAIGPRAGGGVLDSDFRVHGAAGLRVVDASVFPRIPGFFIASAVYMIAEKAADVILAS